MVRCGSSTAAGGDCAAHGSNADGSVLGVGRTADRGGGGGRIFNSVVIARAESGVGVGTGPGAGPRVGRTLHLHATVRARGVHPAARHARVDLAARHPQAGRRSPQLLENVHVETARTSGQKKPRTPQRCSRKHTQAFIEEREREDILPGLPVDGAASKRLENDGLAPDLVREEGAAL